MDTIDNTGLGLIIAAGERVRNEKSLFGSALKKLVNSTEEELDDFLKMKLESRANEGILRLISGGKMLTIKALDGRRLICEAKKTFRSLLIDDFINWGINKPGVATSKTSVQVREMVSDGKLMDIFRALPGTWNQKWLTQDQVIEFCETLPEWLHQEGYSTFFLIKKDESKPINEDKPEDNLFVVYVNVRSGGLLIVRADRIERGNVLRGQDCHHVVSPSIPLAA